MVVFATCVSNGVQCTVYPFTNVYMGKLKTRRSAKKRFRKTKKGIFFMKKSSGGHFLEKKSPKLKRSFSSATRVSFKDSPSVGIMLPYF